MITGIIMASGFSKRMNRQKLTLPVDGIPIIDRVIQAAKNSLLHEIIIIYREEEIKRAAESHGVKAIYNEKADLGQSEAIKLGLREASINADAYMFLVGDQPFINAEAINHLINTFYNHDKEIIVPLYNNERGNPVIFSKKFKDKLSNISGDKGGRQIINEMYSSVMFVTMDDPMVGKDIDTWETYEKMRNGDEMLC